jgi:hypothetical protein
MRRLARSSTSEREQTYAALQRTAVDVVTVQLADGHGGVLVRVHLDKSEATVRLETSLGDIAEVLEQRNEVVLSGVGSEVANVASGLPLGSLSQDGVVGLDALGRELVVLAERTGRGNTHLGHNLLLGERGLTLLVGPVATNSTRAQPLAIHGAESLVGFGAVTESNEAVTTRAASLHVPHNTGLGHAAEGGESLEKDFVVHFVGEIANEDVEVARGVFLGSGVGLIGPVHADFLPPHVSVYSLSCASGNVLTDWWTRLPLRVCMALSAARGSSYSTKP